MQLQPSLIQAYLETYPEEASIVSTFTQFAETGKTSIGHLTTSAWLVDPNTGKVLLTHHKKLDKWLQLGGHLEPQDQACLYKAAHREACEESGRNDILLASRDILHCSIHFIPHSQTYGDGPWLGQAAPDKAQHPFWQQADGRNSNAHFHYDICFVHQITCSQSKETISNESNDLRWFSPSELLTMPDTEPTVKRMAQKWQIMMTETLLQPTS